VGSAKLFAALQGIKDREDWILLALGPILNVLDWTPESHRICPILLEPSDECEFPCVPEIPSRLLEFLPLFPESHTAAKTSQCDYAIWAVLRSLNFSDDLPRAEGDQPMIALLM
jgi:hypothetical protein